MKKLLSIGCCLLFSFFLHAQYYLKGDVKDEKGNRLQNVLILQASTGYVSYSGAAGGFGIASSYAKDTLILSLSGFEKKRIPVNAFAYNTVVLKKSLKPLNAIPTRYSHTKGLRFEQQAEWFTGNETYASTVENGFVPAHKYPTSGISLNVDRASYSNIRRFLNAKSFVPPDAVRIEEMLNYFNFNYKEPAVGKDFEIDTKLTTCPWNDQNHLLFASIRSRKINIDSLPPSNFVFLIDVSSSMEITNRLPLLKAAFRSLVYNLREKDTVTVVVYGGTVGLALPATGGAEKQKILNTIDSLETGGSTPGESGIKLAYRTARDHFIPKGNNRVILATDGDFNVGIRGEEELEEMIATESASGIYLTCLGVGMGNYKDSKIQVLAKKGNGNFAYIDNYAEAEKVMMKEFMQTLYTVADDVYLNLQFDPAYVKHYRIIGFDNKMGAMKDTLSYIEGGEIGSAFSMMIAIEIEPVQKSQTSYSPVNFKLQYQLPYSTNTLLENNKPELTVLPLMQAEKQYQFASSVILFGSLLKDSKYTQKDKLWNDVYELANRSFDASQTAQKEYISLVTKAKQVYTSRKKKRPLNY